jgi:S-disulfanyl-L-cysteine oxidoreductase SoxD
MRCSLNLLVPVMILAAPVAGLAQSRTYNVGTPLSQEEIRSFDFMLGPEGKELPPGHGTAKEGAEIFAKQCAVCHGKNGEGGAVQRLVSGQSRQPSSRPF